jgi:hypothetical protein
LKLAESPKSLKMLSSGIIHATQSQDIDNDNRMNAGHEASAATTAASTITGQLAPLLDGSYLLESVLVG